MDSFKVILCIVLSLAILIYFLVNKNNKENFIDVNLDYIIGKKNLNINVTQMNNDYKNNTDGINVNGTTLASNFCIEDGDGNNSNNCIDKNDLKFIKSLPHIYDRKICIGGTNSQGSNQGSCFEEADARYIKNFKNTLKSKKDNMIKQIINTRPYCNWRGEAYMCGDWTHWYDDHTWRCENNRLTYFLYNGGRTNGTWNQKNWANTLDTAYDRLKREGVDVKN